MCKAVLCNFKYWVAIIFSIASGTGFAQVKPYIIPKVSIFISLKKDTVLSPTDVLIHFEIINKGNTTQRLYLGFPGILTYNSWTVSAKLTRMKVGKPLKYVIRSFTNSHISTEDELKSQIRNISPGGSEATIYKLTDIVVFFNADADHPLPKGWYELQLFYGDVASNKVKFYVSR